METFAFDLVVVGSGPAGQKAAIQGASAGCSVLVIDREASAGGACVHHGTIPSKTLRETAVLLDSFPRRSNLDICLGHDVRISSLTTRLDRVIAAHERYIGGQLERSGVVFWRGKARFLDAHRLEVRAVGGGARVAQGRTIVIATGSRPRTPPEVPIDHEHILDSDSILSLTYLPESLVVLGAGVIASEYASIFACLGVEVTMIDRGVRPLSFLDEELTAHFLASYQASGGRFLGGRTLKGVEWDGISRVVTTLDDGTVVESEKLLSALGRVACLDDLDLAAAGLTATSRGLLAVDAHLRTSVPHIYGAGDVIGPPSLASTSMEQGRRAACHALGIPVGATMGVVPSGIYTIPEMASVGLDEAEARKRFPAIVVGRAPFAELARGQISASTEGLLKLISGPDGAQILGVQIVGEGATELIHIGQMAMIGGQPVDTFIDNIFNFPTLGEAYRVAALDVREQVRGARAQDAAAGLPIAC